MRHIPSAFTIALAMLTLFTASAALVLQSNAETIGSTYTSTEGNGSTLTYDSPSKIYTYTRSDGMVARFDGNKKNMYAGAPNRGLRS